MTNAQAMMALLDKKGWSQRQLAAAMDVTPGTVTRWRNQARQDGGEEVTGEMAYVHQHSLWVAESLIGQSVPPPTKGLEATVRLAMQKLRYKIDKCEEEILELIRKEEA